MATSSITEHGEHRLAIDVQGLTCRYDDFVAVDGLDLTVREGELFALLGTNGAGKTTALETIQGLRQPDGGAVTVLGLDIAADRAAAMSRCGVMLQETGYADELTVRETVGLLGALSGRDDDPDRLLDLAGLVGRRDVRVGQLSGGERRRLDFAVAAYGSPKLLFLDEPTTALDPAARGALWAGVQLMRDAGTTIVLTTHYLEEAERYADRVAVMSQGRIVQQGTVAEVLGRRPSRITFRADPSTVLPVAAVAEPDGSVEIDTFDPQTDLLALLTWASRTRTPLEQLEVSGARLEEIFLDTERAGAPTAAV